MLPTERQRQLCSTDLKFYRALAAQNRSTCVIAGPVDCYCCMLCCHRRLPTLSPVACGCMQPGGVTALPCCTTVPAIPMQLYAAALRLDGPTLANLELLENNMGESAGSLLSRLDTCACAGALLDGLGFHSVFSACVHCNCHDILAYIDKFLRRLDRGQLLQGTEQVHASANGCAPLRRRRPADAAALAVPAADRCAGHRRARRRRGRPDVGTRAGQRS